MTNSSGVFAAIATACVIGIPLHAFAQTPIKQIERPDPAGITVPNMAFTPNAADIRRYDTNYYFYKAGVTYEKAFADLAECRAYALRALILAPPPLPFIPLDAEAVTPTPPVDTASNISPYVPYPYTDTVAGSVGGAIAGALIIGPILQNAADHNSVATKRKCMAYKGYSRYGLPSAVRKQIDEGTDAVVLAREALIASGRAPSAGVIEP